MAAMRPLAKRRPLDLVTGRAVALAIIAAA